MSIMRARMAFAMQSLALGRSDLPTTTWANRPAAGGRVGDLFIVSDIGVAGGSLWFSDGTYWVPAAPITIARSGTKIPIPNNTLTTEQTYATISIPAGALGGANALFMDTLWSYTASTNVKTMRGRFSGAGGSSAIFVSQSGATLLTTRAAGMLRNVDATHQVYASGGLVGGFSAGSAVANSRQTVNTTVATSVVFTGTTALAGEVLDLEWYEVRLLP